MMIASVLGSSPQMSVVVAVAFSIFSTWPLPTLSLMPRASATGPGPGLEQCEHCQGYFSTRGGGITNHRIKCLQKLQRERARAEDRQVLDQEYDGMFYLVIILNALTENFSETS